MHVHLPLYSCTFIGSSDSLDMHIQVFTCYLTDQIFGDDHRHLEELEFSYSIIFIRYFYLFLILVAFMALCIELNTRSILLFICYHCVRYLYVIQQ